jgi:hypothetical protein
MAYTARHFFPSGNLARSDESMEHELSDKDVMYLHISSRYKDSEEMEMLSKSFFLQSGHYSHSSSSKILKTMTSKEIFTEYDQDGKEKSKDIFTLTSHYDRNGEIYKEVYRHKKK